MYVCVQLPQIFMRVCVLPVMVIRNPPVTAYGGASHLGLRAAALRRLASKRACGRSL